MPTKPVDPFESSRYSIEHADRRIAELNTEWERFQNAQPYRRFVDNDIETGEYVHKVTLSEPLPRSLPGIAWDVLGNLRSALDQAGSSIARAASGQRKYAHFPFGQSDVDIQYRYKGASKNLPIEVFDFMVAFQPYKGGDDLLYAMNELRNMPTHEEILKLKLVTSGGTVMMNSGAARFKRIPPLWDDAKNEMELFRTPTLEYPDLKFQFGVLVEFAEMDSVRGKPVGALLDAMARKVESIVAALEAESRRLGFIP